MKTLISSEDSRYTTKKNTNESLDSYYLFPGLKIGVIIPAYNEELNIGKTLEEIPDNISEKFDVIVVDDGSTDKTSEIANRYNITLIKHSQNKGYGAAVTSGLNFCKQDKFDVVVILDADGQHAPKYIKDFIKPIVEENVEFVIGNRFNYHYDMHSLKKLSTRIMTAFYLVFFRRKIKDPTNGYRSLSSKIIKNLELESVYSISQEMLFKIIPFYKLKQIPIIVRQRNHGESFIKMRNYLLKIILLFLKFYIFPKIKKITHKFLSSDFRQRVKKYYLRT
ncbi:MAG: glycosyltransferase family 2 protein [Promethearchaeota archaeon]